MKKRIITLFLLSISNALTAQYFTKQLNSVFEGSKLSSTEFFDADGDGDNDVIILGSSSINVNTFLYLNDGSGVFTLDNSNSFTGAFIGDISIGDIDGDTDLDIIIMGLNALNVPLTELYINDGTGQFSLDNNNAFIGLYDGSISLGDVDGDNDLDLLQCGSDNTSNYSILYLNDGTGNFTEDNTVPFTGITSGESVFVDVDNDNDEDVILIGDDGVNLIAKLYKNNGFGTYTIATSPFAGVKYGSIAFSDIDGDNDEDIFIMGEEAGGTILSSNCYLNDGSGVFTLDAVNNFLSLSNGQAKFLDIDDDGFAELLIEGSDGASEKTKLYLNNGMGGFTLDISTLITDLKDGSIAVSDVDNDTDLDFIICGYNGSDDVTELYINNRLTSGLTNRENTTISIYPNPSKNSIQITSNEKIVSIKITSLDGKTILSREAINSIHFTQNISELDAGIYLITIYNQESYTILKIIVE